MNWGLTSDVRILFAAVFGALYAPVVMTGLHHMTNAIDTQMVNVMGYTILWPMIALSNIAQGSAVLAMSVLQKKNERAQQVNVPACISCYLGVTEPALFGVNLKYRFPLVCGMIGSACAAMLCTGLGVQALSIGVGGLPGILSIKFECWIAFALCMVVAIVVPFALTFVAEKRSSPRSSWLAATLLPPHPPTLHPLPLPPTLSPRPHHLYPLPTPTPPSPPRRTTCSPRSPARSNPSNRCPTPSSLANVWATAS